MSTLGRRSAWAGLMCLVIGTALGATAGQRDTKNAKDKVEDSKRPKLTLKAQPPISVAPARVVLTAELVGGANDYEEFYCPSIEWDWGDGTTSETTPDCQPYEAGKSEIKRRFTIEHRFRLGDCDRGSSAGCRFLVSFRLKRNTKALATASVTIQVQAGVGGTN